MSSRGLSDFVPSRPAWALVASADLSCDCLRSTGPQQWAVHVPLGKLKTERMVPVDPFVGAIVQRLAFFRSLDPLPADGKLLARPRTKEALVRQLRDYLHRVCHALGLSTRIVPHQLRHYAEYRNIPRRLTISVNCAHLEVPHSA